MSKIHIFWSGFGLIIAGALLNNFWLPIFGFVMILNTMELDK